MISRPNSSIPKKDDSPSLLYSDPRCSQTCRRSSHSCCRGSQVLPNLSSALLGAPKPITISPMVLLYQSSEIPVTLKSGRNALLGSDTLLKLTHLSLHSTSSQTLLEASSDWNTFCWCSQICTGYSRHILRDINNIFYSQSCHWVYLSFLMYKNSQNDVYRQQQPHCTVINRDSRPTIVDAPLTLIFNMGQGGCCFLFIL